MKKQITTILAAILVTLCASAQGSKYSVATNSFFNNTFLNAGSGYTLKNADFHLSLGKWFTPGIGFRVKGVYGNNIADHHSCHYSNKYLLVNSHTMFNLTNLFMGYDDSRVYSFIPFVGGGLARSCSFNQNALNFSFGVMNAIRLSQRVALNAEIGRNCFSNDFHGPSIAGHKNHDNWYYELGITVKIGSKKGWKRAADPEVIRAEMQAELDALNAQLEDERMENQRLQEELEKAQKPAQ